MAPKNHRLCISCRRTAHRDLLWRVVRTFPEHRIQLDGGMGRSAYLCKRAACLSAARKKNRLGRVLKAPVPAEIYEQLEARLATENSQGCSKSPEHLRSPDRTESTQKPLKI
ncbi:MAG: YlxR family protein [Cyanobacteria bacterium J06623_4]